MMVPVVLIGMTLGWVSDRAQDIAHRLAHVLGLERFEDWFRRQHIWLPATIILFLCVIFLFFKKYEIGLLFHGHILKAVVFGLIFKVLWFGVMNYIIRIYAVRFLEIAWIARSYEYYKAKRDGVVAYLKSTAAYQVAKKVRTRIRALLKLRSVLAIAKRFLAKISRKKDR